MKYVVLVHGKPGLGKTTLAGSIAETLAAQGISTGRFSLGERLRAISSGETESVYTPVLTAQNNVLHKHQHITDPTVIHGVVSEFLQGTSADIVIIDGHPRYQETTQGYSDAMAAAGRKTLCVVIIDGSDDLAVERMASRAREGVSEDYRWRLADYQTTMAPVFAWLKSNYPVVHINAANELPSKTAEACNYIVSLL